MSSEARFCSSCGLALDAAAVPRHLYGVLAPGPTFVLACLLILAGVLALVVGSPLVAIVLGACSGATFVLFYGAARRDRNSPVARRMLASGHHLRGWAVFGRESVDAWVSAVLEVSRLRREAQSLRRERRNVLLALGEASYREDAAASQELRRRLRELDDGIATREQERVATLAKTRRLVSDERMAARPTQQLSVEHLGRGAKPK